MKKIPNPWKKILANAMGAQNGWNKKHQKLGVNRPVKSFSVTPEDIEKVYNAQGGRSRWLGLPIDPNDVFKVHYPLAPSLDRLDNNKDYTPDNICISTRFENWGFNRASDDTKNNCVKLIKENLKNDND